MNLPSSFEAELLTDTDLIEIIIIVDVQPFSP